MTLPIPMPEEGLCMAPGADPDGWVIEHGAGIPINEMTRPCRGCPRLNDGSCAAWAFQPGQGEWRNVLVAGVAFKSSGIPYSRDGFVFTASKTETVERRTITPGSRWSRLTPEQRKVRTAKARAWYQGLSEERRLELSRKRTRRDEEAG